MHNGVDVIEFGVSCRFVRMLMPVFHSVRILMSQIYSRFGRKVVYHEPSGFVWLDAAQVGRRIQFFDGELSLSLAHSFGRFIASELDAVEVDVVSSYDICQICKR